MKRMLTLGLAIVVAVAAQAAQFDWQYNVTKTDVGATVYVLLGTVQDSFESVDSITQLKKDSDTVVQSGRNFIAKGSAVLDNSKETSFYYVIVKSDQSGYFVSNQQDASGFVYDEGSGAPGTSLTQSKTALSYTAFSGGTGPTPGPGPEGVPEPTSGLLLVVGGAMLALRRKQR